MTDFDINVTPGLILEDIQQFNAENFEDKMKVEMVAGKCIKITIPDSEEGGENHTVVKVKFYRIDDTVTRVRFIKKSGDLYLCYNARKQIHELQWEQSQTLGQTIEKNLVA